MPVPAAAPPASRVVSMSTRAGSTCAAIADVLTPVGALPVPDEPDPRPDEPDPRPDEPDPRPDEPGDGMVPKDGAALVEAGLTKCSTAAPATPDAATTRAAATATAIPRFPTGVRFAFGQYGGGGVPQRSWAALGGAVPPDPQ
jgi:hypothetical protein